MLEELTVYKTFGSIHHLRAIALAIASFPCSPDDLFIIADRESAAEIPRIGESVDLLRSLGLCEMESDKVRGSKKLVAYAAKPQLIEKIIARELLKQMLLEGIIPLNAVQYCSENGYAYLNQYDISTRYSQMRNFLIEAEVFEAHEGRLVFDSHGEVILQDAKVNLLRGLSPERLMEKLERDKEAGAAAEAFVVEYEKRRIGGALAGKVQQVSLIAVAAGYDIASFETVQSTKPDRFIEVKAIGDNGFYFSKNELDTAKKLGAQYCLYLVDMKKVEQNDYVPEIIRNPSLVFSDTSDWRIVPDSYHVTRVN